MTDHEITFDTEPATIRILHPGLYKVGAQTLHIPESGFYEIVWGPEGFKSLTRLGDYGDER